MVQHALNNFSQYVDKILTPRVGSGGTSPPIERLSPQVQIMMSTFSSVRMYIILLLGSIRLRPQVYSLTCSRVFKYVTKYKCYQKKKIVDTM